MTSTYEVDLIDRRLRKLKARRIECCEFAIDCFIVKARKAIRRGDEEAAVKTTRELYRLATEVLSVTGTADYRNIRITDARGVMR